MHDSCGILFWFARTRIIGSKSKTMPSHEYMYFIQICCLLCPCADLCHNVDDIGITIQFLCQQHIQIAIERSNAEQNTRMLTVWFIVGWIRKTTDPLAIPIVLWIQWFHTGDAAVSIQFVSKPSPCVCPFRPLCSFPNWWWIGPRGFHRVVHLQCLNQIPANHAWYTSILICDLMMREQTIKQLHSITILSRLTNEGHVPSITNPVGFTWSPIHNKCGMCFIVETAGFNEWMNEHLIP